MNANDPRGGRRGRPSAHKGWPRAGRGSLPGGARTGASGAASTETPAAISPQAVAETVTRVSAALLMQTESATAPERGEMAARVAAELGFSAAREDGWPPSATPLPDDPVGGPFEACLARAER